MTGPSTPLTTWVDGAAGSLFDLDNLPYGVFSLGGDDARVGVRIGDHVLDLAPVAEIGDPASALAAAWRAPSLNAFMSMGPEQWAIAREWITEVLGHDVHEARTAPHVHPLSAVTLHLPIEVGDYVDFYASEHHASNVGRIFRPDQEPLLPNWKHLPVGYHGRSGTVVASGTDIVRPCGQRKAPTEDAPTYGPSRRLDIEAELGFVVGVPTLLGERVSTADFATHTFGVVGLNDWSARDVQAWEYVPLGPFLGKSFATSISHWVTPLAALDAAWTELPGQDPRAAGLPASRRSGGARHRDRGGARRRGRLPPAVRLDVLVAGPDARPHHRQRGHGPHRGPVGLGHGLGPRRRPARLPAGAVLGRDRTLHGGRARAHLPRGRRRGHPALHRPRRVGWPDRAGRGHRTDRAGPLRRPDPRSQVAGR